MTGGSGATGADGSEEAGVEPPAFVATTRMRIVAPTSAGVRSYVTPVSPAMSTQAEPVLSQRRHWRAYVMVGVPVHAPTVEVSV